MRLRSLCAVSMDSAEEFSGLLAPLKRRHIQLSRVVVESQLKSTPQALFECFRSPVSFSLSGVEQRDETPGKGRAVTFEVRLFEYFLEPRLSVIDQKESGWLLDGIDEIPFDAIEIGQKAIRTRLFSDKAHQQFILKPARADDVNGFSSQSSVYLRRRFCGFYPSRSLL